MIVISAALILAASVVAEAPVDELKAEFEHAGKCRVHTQLLPMITPKDPVLQAKAKSIYDYWIKTSDALGIAAGYKPEELEWQYLLIPVTPDESLIDRCVKEALEDGALK